MAVTLIELMQYDDLIGMNDIINLKIGAVFAAVLGHIFPVFAGFRGGKGRGHARRSRDGHLSARSAALLRRLVRDADGLALRVALLDDRRMLLSGLHAHLAQGQRIRSPSWSFRS